MEKEQIIKALECCFSNCSCDGCPITEMVDCRRQLERNIFALIKELTIELDAMRGAANSYKMHNERLTEENEKLRKAKVVYETVDYCADDLAKALEENERLTEENEKLTKKIEMSEAAYQGLQFALSICANQVKADTLNDMQTRFAMHFGTYRHTDVVKVTEVFKLLKKISGEMLYEEEECPSCKHFVGCECFDGETCDLYEKNTEDEEK